ncbi:hypothetical protein ScPMuIL_006569 [Solemya velum]
MPSTSEEWKNLLSATQQPAVVDELLLAECEKGFLLGPYTDPPFDIYRISPLGIATGKYSAKNRLIVDLSAPHNHSSHFSINDTIDKAQCSLSYVTVDDAIRLIQQCGRGAWLCKADIRDAFKLLPIRRDRWPLFGIKWKGLYYFYHRLAFGCRSSPLSKFLRAMQSEGYIKVKELNKGVDSVTEFDKSHPGLRNFCVPEMAEAEKAMSGDCESVNDYEAPEIVDMFSVNTAVLPVLSTFGYRKGNALSPEDVRKILTEYVKNNQLQSEGKRSHVVLDPVLAHLVLNKDEGDVSSLKWEEFFSRFLSKMQASHQITFPGQQPITHKGKIEPITIDVVRRAGNKKVTLIDQLEFFGINPEAFAHAIQIGVACSTSINPSTQKGRGMQVLVQGNQLNFIANLLTEKYKINKKFIQVAEKAVKSVKKR